VRESDRLVDAIEHAENRSKLSTRAITGLNAWITKFDENVTVTVAMLAEIIYGRPSRFIRDVRNVGHRTINEIKEWLVEDLDTPIINIEELDDEIYEINKNIKMLNKNIEELVTRREWLMARRRLVCKLQHHECTYQSKSNRSVRQLKQRRASFNRRPERLRDQNAKPIAER
jgi:ABC-type phosphate transport system auxiliary subunit